jgi:broad specificity phosphatase PhoE
MLLREMSFGVRERLPREITVEEAIKIVAARDGIPIEDVIDTAETVEVLKQRQVKFLSEILHPELVQHNLGIKADNEPLDKILCVSHGGFIRRFLDNFCDKKYNSVGNCSITRVIIEWPSESAHDFICNAEHETINVIDHISKDF